MKLQRWSLPTRFLHLGLVATVTFQLLISFVMAEPDHKGGPMARLAFEAHEVIGLSALLIVFLHWVWTFTNQTDGGLRNLFPWFGQERQKLFEEVRAMLRGHFPEGESRGGLVGLIHGLGLLAVTAIAVTGGILFLLFPETGEPGVVAEAFAELHEGLASLVWVYWLGHGGIAIVHHAMGHDTVKNMFNFKVAEKVGHKVDQDSLTRLS